MSKGLIRSICITIVSVIIITSLNMVTFAAEHDDTEDVSSDTATLRLGKQLAYIHKKKNPVSSVTYTIEKVRAWENNSESSEENGREMPVSEMPEPEYSSVEIDLTDNGEGNASGVKNVKICFEKAGYYVYRIRETPLEEIEGARVESDPHEYFAVIYVCNRTDENGNTIDGVYVHDITSYRNESGSSEYSPDLSDIANITDNGEIEAKENTIENLGKVGKSDPSTPDVLEAYRMWNAVENPEPVSLVITKNVVGSLGDITKEFSFYIEITGLEENAAYPTYGPGVVQDDPEAGTWDNITGYVTSDEHGEIRMRVLIKDDQSFTFTELPIGAHWRVSEEPNNHKASYEVSPASCTETAVAENDADSTMLTAEGEFIEDTTVAFVNKRDIAVLTGVPSAAIPYAAVLAVLACLAIATFIRKKNGDGRLQE